MRALWGILAVGLLFLLLVILSRQSRLAPERVIPAGPGQQDIVPDRWVSISYGELIDPGEITQSGDTIESVQHRLPQDPVAYSQLQPFLEPYAHLLPDALDVLNGPSENPRRQVDDAYPLGAARPAWVDLLRGGRYIVTYDGDHLATIFAPGRNAQAAYDNAVGVLRHPLAALQASTGGPLQVEVYAYENDYASSELRLLMNRYSFRATSFGPPHGKKRIDLQALDNFFVAGNELVGARVDSEDGLVLVGNPSVKMTLAGHRASVADLAVAYRAVFHAGHNDAFISLDPSKVPQRVRVNFGGALEDTRLGSVVLASDMRFKTLASGLDPVSYADLRRSTRARVPEFMTVSERDLASSEGVNKKAWEGTRFWFYPDAVEVVTDLEGRIAYVEKARFTADAERSRADFGTSDQFETFKKTRLSPSIRANIDDLNSRYGYYAAVFPELQELTAVARLMGICSWLRNAPTGEVDLDGLLAAKLPAWQTPRDKPQLLSVAVVTYAGKGAPSADEVLARTTVRRIDPLLDQPVRNVFPTEKALSDFLVATGNGLSDPVMASAAKRLCRDYIRTQEDLKSFAEVVADRIMGAAPTPLAELSQNLGARRAHLEDMEHELESLRGVMATDAATHDSYVDQYNALVGKYNSELNRHNALAQWASQLDAGVLAITTIEGGIDLAPTQFKVTPQAASPELDLVRTAVSERAGGRGLIRSPRPADSADAPSESLPWRWITADKGERDSAGSVAGTDAAGNRFWKSRRGPEGGWKERIVFSGGRAIERVYDSLTKELRVANYDHGTPETYLVAHLDASGKVIFTRRSPSSLDSMRPAQPQ